MALPQEVLDSFAKLDTATTNAGVYVADLRAKVKVGMTPEQVAEVVAGLGKVETFLTSIASDPDNPTPPAPPEFASVHRR